MGDRQYEETDAMLLEMGKRDRNQTSKMKPCSYVLCSIVQSTPHLYAFSNKSCQGRVEVGQVLGGSGWSPIVAGLAEQFPMSSWSDPLAYLQPCSKLRKATLLVTSISKNGSRIAIFSRKLAARLSITRHSRHTDLLIMKEKLTIISLDPDHYGELRLSGSS